MCVLKIVNCLLAFCTSACALKFILLSLNFDYKIVEQMFMQILIFLTFPSVNFFKTIVRLKTLPISYSNIIEIVFKTTKTSYSGLKF